MPVNRTGRGINRMFAEQLRVGRSAPDYGRSTDAHVVAVLPGGPANLSMTKWVLEQESRIVERGWIEARGDGKGRTWHLSAALYRVLDAPAGYVRVRGFDRLQQVQMILQFVSAHGHISRTQAAELCSLTPDQASRVLRRLTTERHNIRTPETLPLTGPQRQG